MAGFIAFSLQAAAYPQLSENTGFCAGGSPSAQGLVATWGSYCAAGDAGLGRAVSPTFQLTGPLNIYLSGDPSGKGLSLRLENLSEHRSLEIRPGTSPGATWVKSQFDIPASWRHKDLRIVAEDQSIGPMGWLAFSLPTAASPSEDFAGAKRILLKTPLFAFLLFLPGFTLAAIAVAQGIRGNVKLGMITLAGIALPGYLLFFIYVLSSRVGHFISLLFPYACGALLLFFLLRLPPTQRLLLRPLLIPAALTLFGSLGILSLGYLYGGINIPGATAQNRFSHPLPPDNEIPYLFAAGLSKGSVPSPLLGDWLSSDRPPLQSGIILQIDPWIKNSSWRPLFSHVVAVLSQSLWIFALWLLLKAFRISGLSTATVIFTIYLSGFVIVNTFFVWPKLLAAAYLVAFAIPILTARPQAGHRSWLLRFLLSFLLVCSLLSHGGTVFALMGLLLFMLIRFRRQMVRETCWVGVITVLLYSPWIAYQKFVDPPGDRLVKFHLAGVEQVTKEPALQTIVAAYRKLTFAEWLSVREGNRAQAFGHESEYLKEVFGGFMSPQSRVQIRVMEFFHCLPTLGFSGFGIAALFLRWRQNRNRHEMRAAERLILWAFITTIPWILLMFERYITVVHAGPYAMELAAMSGAILALRSVAPKTALVVCLAQSVFHWFVYLPDLSHAAFPLSLPLQTNHYMLALHLVSLCGFVALLAIRGKRAGANISPGVVSTHLHTFASF